METNTSIPVLQLQHLQIETLTGTPLVQDVSLQIREGEILGLLGESGSGKSLTCMSVTRLLSAGLRIASGKCLFTDKEGKTTDLFQIPDPELRKIRGRQIAYIFQEPMTALNPTMRCGEQIAETLLYHQLCSKDRIYEKVKELLTEVEITETERVMNSYPHQLSGGQRQRVMIACALGPRPRLLIADEPTTALDPLVQEEILQLLRRLSRQYRTGMLLVSHDLGALQKTADSLAVMYRGKLVESGNAEQLSEHASHPYTRGLINCRPVNREPGKLLFTLSDFMDENGNEKPQISQPEPEPMTGAGNIIMLETRDLAKKYMLPGHQVKIALKDASITMKQGECLGLIGESGSGKSTLGKLLVSLETPDSGEILFHGDKNQHISRARQIQLVFQDPYASLNPRKTIAETLTEPMRVHGLGKNSEERLMMAAQLLEKTGLKKEDLNKYPRQFSGGQRQRIGIARALAVQPSLLICDEAVSALDMSVQAQVLNLLKKIQAELQLTLLFITHDMSVARFMCNRIVVLRNGRIVESGNTEDLFARPQNEYTKRLTSIH